MEIPRPRPTPSIIRLFAAGLLIVAASLAILQRSLPTVTLPLSSAAPDVSSQQTVSEPSPTPGQSIALAAEPTWEPAPSASAEPTPTLDAQAVEAELPSYDSPLPTAEASPTELSVPEPTATPADAHPTPPDAKTEPPSPSATAQSAKPTSTPTPAPEPTNTSVAPSYWPPTSTPRPQSTPTWTPKPANTSTSTPRPQNTPTWTPRPAATPTWTPAATSTSRPTATKTSTPKPTATKTPTPRPTATAVTSGGSYSSTAESLALTLINQSRAAKGLRAVTMSSAIQGVARAYAKDMATRNYFSHTSPEGLNVWDRLDRAGIGWSWCGENLGLGSGYASPSDAVRSMHNSMMNEVAPNDGHKRVILSTSAGKVGIGVYTTSANKTYYVSDYTN